MSSMHAYQRREELRVKRALKVRVLALGVPTDSPVCTAPVCQLPPEPEHYDAYLYGPRPTSCIIIVALAPSLARFPAIFRLRSAFTKQLRVLSLSPPTKTGVSPPVHFPLSHSFQPGTHLVTWARVVFACVR